MTGAVTLWRCSKCGKWSHAQRRPKRHERYIREDDIPDVDWREPGERINPLWMSASERPVEVDGCPVIDWNEGGSGAYDSPEDIYTQGYVRVWCGPFDEWQAERVR